MSRCYGQVTCRAAFQEVTLLSDGDASELSNKELRADIWYSILYPTLSQGSSKLTRQRHPSTAGCAPPDPEFMQANLNLKSVLSVVAAAGLLNLVWVRVLSLSIYWAQRPAPCQGRVQRLSFQSRGFEGPIPRLLANLTAHASGSK